MTATVLSFLLIVVENDIETTAEIKISWGAAPRIEIMYFHREHRPNVQNASGLARTPKHFRSGNYHETKF